MFYFLYCIVCIIALSGCLDFLPSTQYRGNLSTTANGRKCQAWSSSWPHDHDFHTDSLFQVDGSLKAAENYCRDPSNKGRIWCFTTDPDVTWEFCNFHACTVVYHNNVHYCIFIITFYFLINYSNKLSKFFYNFIFPSQHASDITYINMYNSLNHGLYLHTVFEFLVIYSI